MISCSLQEVARVVGGTVLQNTNHPISGVTTDSRKTVKGMLFIPLRGENFDGHDYIESALRGGAEAVLTEKAPTAFRQRKGYVQVEDTQKALHDLAAWYRDKFDIPMVQITGSAGKTTTKEMIAGVLSRHFRVLKTEANFNNHVGTPMTLLGLSKEHEAAVIETGMNHFGEIRSLGQMVKPDIAVITNIGDAHIEYLGGNRQGVLRAKSEIFENLRSGGTAILNGDDPLLRTLHPDCEVIWCGSDADCAVRIMKKEEHGIHGTACRIATLWGTYDLTIPTPGSFMVYPVAMAIAVGEKLRLSRSEILQGIEAYTPPNSRMQIMPQSEDRIIIDDCYNANPQAMAEALKLLHQTDCAHRLAVLGDMGELGTKSEAFHRTVGATADDYGDMDVIAIGEKSEVLAEEAKGQWFATIPEALPAIREAFTPGTVMLVKASHAMKFEEIVKEFAE